MAYNSAKLTTIGLRDPLGLTVALLRGGQFCQFCRRLINPDEKQALEWSDHMQMPKLLNPGDTVAILATSGPCDQHRLTTGVETIKRMGLKPWVMESCHTRHDFLAGPDDLRIRDLHAAFASRHLRGILVARGGYGAARLLGGLDYDLISANPKVFVGYSDVTALHVVFNQRCGFVTFHGPMPASDFYDGGEPFTVEALKKMIFATPQQPYTFRGGLLENPPGQPLITIFPGHATGPIIGGNLCLLAASIGTPYEVDTRGCILFLEETGEDPYRVDRMLLQLKQAGKLSQAAGIILGDFSPQTPESLHIPISELVATEKKPTLAGLACGHTSPSLTLPLGHNVLLDANKKQIVLRRIP